MIATRYELLFCLLAVLVGGYVLRNVFLAEQPQRQPVTGFIEIQRLPLSPRSAVQEPVIQKTGGYAPGIFNGDDFAWFATRQIGDEIIFELNGLEEGDQLRELHLASSGDFGVVDVMLNGAIVVKAVDLYAGLFNPEVPIRFSNAPLRRNNELSFQVIGSNPATSPPHYQIGIDGVVIEQLLRP